MALLRDQPRYNLLVRKERGGSTGGDGALGGNGEEHFTHAHAGIFPTFAACTWKASQSRSFLGIFLHLESKDATISDMAASSSPAEFHKTSRYLLLLLCCCLLQAMILEIIIRLHMIPSPSPPAEAYNSPRHWDSRAEHSGWRERVAPCCGRGLMTTASV